MGLTGAIMGDIAGSRFEFREEQPDWENCAVFHEDCVFTDDTVESLAIGLAAAENVEPAVVLRSLCNQYLFVGYGGSFHKWLKDPQSVSGDSWGNGSSMRVSSLGEQAESLVDAERMAEASAVCTHNSEEGIRGAKAIAGCVFLAKTGASREQISEYAKKLYPQERCTYYVGRPLSEYRDEYQFEVRCDASVPVAIECFLESTSFESCLRNVFFMHGDTDTLGAMAGAIAESFYPATGFDNESILKYYLDDTLFQIWKRIQGKA